MARHVAWSRGLVYPAVLLFLLSAAGAVRAASDDNLLILTAATRMPGLAKSVEKVIGPSGGSVATGQATLTVPSGALDAEAWVVISGQRPGTEFGSQDATKGYKISLGTTTVRKPLTLTIAGFGGADRDVLLALSDAVTDYAGNSNASRPTMIDGQVHNGILTVTIPAPEIDESAGGATAKTASGQASPPLKSAVNTWHEYALWTVSGRNSLRSDHFRVTYPTALVGQSEDYPQLILDHAEAAYALLCAMGYVYAANLNWPMTITLQQNLGVSDGYAEIPLSGKRNGFIVLNQNLCAPEKLELLKATVGHELFHHVQNTYDPRSGIRIRHQWLKPYFLWLAEASSVWFERRFLGKPSYVAEIFTKNYNMMPLGLETYADHAAAQGTGYFASGFLRYLAETRNESVIRSAWEEVRDMGSGSAQYSDLTALGRGIGSITDAAVSWQVYMDKFISGTTGFSGWETPGSSLTWYNQSAIDPVYDIFYREIGNITWPFSGQKWSLIFNKDLGERTYMIRLVDPQPNVVFTLYRGASPEGPFSFVKALSADTPYVFEPETHDLYIVSVVNTDTTAPYTTPTLAAFRIGMTGTSTLCPNEFPPNSWVGLSSDKRIRTIKDGDDRVGYYVLEAYYDEARTEPAFVECNKANGECDFAKEWYQNGNVKTIHPYNAQCNLHGEIMSFYESGPVAGVTTFVDGQMTGFSAIYYETGVIQETGTYLNGKKNGDWCWYNGSGEWQACCDYVNGVEGECRTPTP